MCCNCFIGVEISMDMLTIKYGDRVQKYRGATGGSRRVRVYVQRARPADQTIASTASDCATFIAAPFLLVLLARWTSIATPHQLQRKSGMHDHERQVKMQSRATRAAEHQRGSGSLPDSFHNVTLLSPWLTARMLPITDQLTRHTCGTSTETSLASRQNGTQN